MKKIQILILLVFIAISFASCYIDNNQNDNTTGKSVIEFNLPIPESVIKAPASGYYFVITLEPSVGEEFSREIALGSFDPYNGGAGGIFPVIVTEVPEGLYVNCDVEFRHVIDGLKYIGWHSTEFTITKGENTIIDIQIGEFW